MKTPMGLFKKRAVDPAEMEQLRTEIATMASRLAEADAAKAELGAKVDGMATRLDTPVGKPPTGPPPALVDPAEVGAIREQLDRMSDRLNGVEARISAISTELANQINEISADLDQLGNDAPPAERVVDELRDAQERLAGEQARYQIAFRQDLAELADRLRRT